MQNAAAAQDVAGKQNESSQSSPNQTFEDLNFDSINDSTHEEDKHMSFDQHEGSKPAQLAQVELSHQNKSMLLTSTQQPQLMQAPATAAAEIDAPQPSSAAPNNFLAGADQNTLNMFSTMI